MDRKMVEFIKEQYPPGTRIRLNSMDDPYAPIVPGTEGEVDFVDDIGQLHMKWDNGRTLALVPGEDSFSVLPPKLTTLKLYIIVPVYQVENYLRQCVDSILAQTFTDFELILVDDGSKDRSGQICDEYAEMDERVKVIHKENSGPSDTRNRGIEQAAGNYFMFVDSDDYIAPTIQG